VDVIISKPQEITFTFGWQMIFSALKIITSTYSALSEVCILWLLSS